MRVLVLSSTFPSANEPTRGIFIRERIRHLAQHCDLVILAPVPWFPLNRWIRGKRATVPFFENQEGLGVYHPRFLSFPRYAKFLDGALCFLSLVWFMARLRRSFAFDLLDVHFEFPDGVAGTLLARLFRRPVIVTLRGKLVRLSEYRLHRPQLRWMLRHANRVTAVSHSLCDIAEGLGRRPEGVRVIRNGVDTEKFYPMDRTQARRLCGLPQGRKILLTIAALYPHKGQHRMIAVLPGLLQRYPDLLYVMIGGGRPGERYVRELETLVARLGLGEHVLFLGPRLHADLRPWFCAADLFVLLTQSEGWPNVLLESLACGLPVVATRVGGVPEIVRHGTDGFLVPYGDEDAAREAICHGLEGQWDREELLRHARSLDWAGVVGEVLDEMAAALRQGAPRPTYVGARGL